jgi:probable F420-dependent oxidoreductase
MPVRVGVQIQPQHSSYAKMIDAWKQADDLGVDTIYTWDHFYPLYGDPDGPNWEGLTALSALAAVTSRARIGALVFCNSYRNPQLLAASHVAIDHISGGRAILGIGAGWFERDYDEFGYEFGTAPDRLRALTRDLPLMRSRIDKHVPPPVGDLPILIGGAGEKVTLKLVAQHAQLWHTFADLETYHHKRDVLAAHCERIDRDPATIEHVIGARENIIDLAPGLADAGVAEITVGIGGDGEGYDLSELRRLLEWRDAYNG